ncbi:MAG: TonB-dependent receptor, partial [Cytophagaceae bacterium]
MYDKNIGTKQKALRINLDRRIYGSFAEIGAGQETAAMFFKAGGSSGTIAKTMSAYDMTFSDSIYGVEESGRYVVESRLVKMLSKEYSLLEKRLAEKRGPDTTFFSFANTVVALNYQKTNDAHGWIGCRFQLSPQSGYNDVIIHVRMLDNENILQQQALGIIGVNLIYGCYYYAKSPETLVLSLMDDLIAERIQIDMIRFNGPDFAEVDNRLMTLHNLKANDKEIDEKDFLDRVDILCSMGQTVMISNYLEYYKLVAYLARLTRLKCGIVVGVPNLEYIFDEGHYEFLPGGILESFATLFSKKVKLFVYPTLRDGAIYTCDDFHLPPMLEPLYQYLILNNKIEPEFQVVFASLRC